MSWANDMGQTSGYVKQAYTNVLAAVQLSGMFEKDTVFLAPFTDSTKRIPGTILAELTGGPDVGKYVNYKDSATNGQGQAMAILIDQYLNPDDLTSPASAEIVRIGRVYASALLLTTGSTLVTALTQLRATKFYDGGRFLCYDIRGPIVS